MIFRAADNYWHMVIDKQSFIDARLNFTARGVLIFIKCFFDKAETLGDYQSIEDLANKILSLNKSAERESLKTITLAIEDLIELRYITVEY